MRTQGSQARALGKPITDQIASGTRQEDLSAIANSHQPRAPKQGRPEVVLTVDLNVAGVEAHANANLTDGPPVVRTDHALTRNRRRETVTCTLEAGIHAIAQSFEHGATVGL